MDFPVFSEAELDRMLESWARLSGPNGVTDTSPERKEVIDVYSEIFRRSYDVARYWFKRQEGIHDCLSAGMEVEYATWLLSLESRQTSLMESVMATVMLGRPEVGSILIRSMYEALIYTLLLSIERDVKLGKKSVLTRSDIIANYRQSVNSERIDDKNEGNWHGLGNFWQVTESIWPEKGSPAFSHHIMPDDQGFWKALKTLAYNMNNNEVHINPVSVLTFELNVREGELE